ncbi:MAG: bifunctional hydroxymethylpyrimidine kinase/phosphomethylpyrimidine kinase [Candidatus Adiutrix sp.]
MAAPSVETFPIKHALTIASSDSGAGAGIQADLKTFAAHKVYGLCAISAVTAQNTMAVTAMECVSASLLTAQLEAIFADIKVEAVKVGLLGNASNTQAMGTFFSQRVINPAIILDPVMVSASGHTFLEPSAIKALMEFMPQAALLTPNIPEAQVLSGLAIKHQDDMIKAAEKIVALGVKAVLIKGGHSLGSEADDLLYEQGGPIWLRGEKIQTINNHGTGCTLSASIAAQLALGFNLLAACQMAKEYVAGGLKHSISLGSGPGPLNHFHQYYNYM